MGVFDPLDHTTAQEDLTALSELCRQFASDAPVVEVGSWVGLTALTLAKHASHVYCVDTFEGSPTDRTGVIAGGANLPEFNKVLSTFCQNMGHRLFTQVTPVVGTSRFWSMHWSQKVRLIFIDASHDYASVRSDILRWRPWVEPGGVICGHDFGDQFPGVGEAVRELVPARDLVIWGKAVWWTRI